MGKFEFRKVAGIVSISTIVLMVITITLLLIFRSNVALFMLYKNINALFNSSIFEISINIYTFFITIIFTLIGFSINKISKYKLTTRDYIRYLSYFGGVLIYFVISIITNIIFNFNGYIYPQNIISLILLIGSFVIFLSLIFFTIDTFQSENLFHFISKNTQKFIKKYKKEDKKHNKLMRKLFKIHKTPNLKKIKDDFNTKIIGKMNIIFENLISAINKNDFLVSKKILEEIPKIVNTYLEETKKFTINDDRNFAFDLNDNFNFTFDSIKNNYNEKLYEHLVKSMSECSMSFLNNRKLIDYDSRYPIYFLASLESFFYETFKLKRTIVCPLIVQEIRRHILFYDKEYNGYNNVYDHYLKNIEQFLQLIIKLESEGKIAPSGKKDFWANMVYRDIIITKRKRFLGFLSKSLTHKYVDDQIYHLENYFKGFSEGFLKIKENSKHLEIIYPCLFMDNSFVFEIAKLNLTKLGEVQKINTSSYIKEYFKFNKEIILNSFENNNIFVYQFYSDFISYIINNLDIKKEDKEEIIREFFTTIIENLNLVIKKREEDDKNNSRYHRDYSYSNLKSNLVDSIAILGYNHSEYTEVIEEIIKKLIRFYLNLKKEQKESIL